MSDALGTPGGVVSDEDHRLAMAGMIAPQTSSLAVRTGVMWGPGTTALVTGTSATGTMTVNVALHHWVTTRGTGDGIYLGAKEATGTVNIAAAPGSNSRIDVVYSKQNDSGSTISADGSTGELYSVALGTAGASPVKPAIPVGAVEIATVQIAAGTTNTLGAGATITNTAAQTVARGARIPVRNSTERGALTTYAGLEVYRLDTGAVEQRNAANSAWITVYDPTITGRWVTVYEGDYTYSQTVNASSTTLSGCTGSVVVPSGYQLEMNLQIPRVNVPSGGGVFVRLLVDGVAKRAAAVQTGSTPSTAGAWPLDISATATGTGASIAIAANVYGLGTFGTVQGTGDTFPGGGPLFRYRII